MIADSLLVSAASVLGFVAGLFGLLLVLAWLEHPEVPQWLRRHEWWSRGRPVEPVRVRTVCVDDLSRQHRATVTRVAEVDD